MPISDPDSAFLPVDSLTESSSIIAYPRGISFMELTAAGDWGPNDDAAGHVRTERTGSSGVQVFTDYSEPASYQRFFVSSAWSAWRLITTEVPS